MKKIKRDDEIEDTSAKNRKVSVVITGHGISSLATAMLNSNVIPSMVKDNVKDWDHHKRYSGKK